MKRPSEDLLNEFYELAELNEENRLKAVKRFLENKVSFIEKSRRVRSKFSRGGQKGLKIAFFWQKLSQKMTIIEKNRHFW
jgi:hypothetical protein